MEEITHYPVSIIKENGEKNEKVTFVSIDNIILDPGMEFTGRLKCHKILLEKKVKTLNNGIETQLYKWDKVEKDFQEKKKLDPVKLSKFKESIYYTVLDGRHRCMLSFFNEYTHIPAIIFD